MILQLRVNCTNGWDRITRTPNNDLPNHFRGNTTMNQSLRSRYLCLSFLWSPFGSRRNVIDASLWLVASK